MSKAQRLASFTTPRSSPSRQRQTSAVLTSPDSKTLNQNETTLHRKIRGLLFEFRSNVQAWEKAVHDGLSHIKFLTDTRTELNNLLQIHGLPRKPMIRDHLARMEAQLNHLRGVILALRKQFSKLVKLSRTAEAVISDIHLSKGWDAVVSEPLWCTWPLVHFYDSLLDLLPVFDRSLSEKRDILDIITPNTVKFEDSRKALSAWSSTTTREAWQDLDHILAVEVDGWEDAVAS